MNHEKLNIGFKMEMSAMQGDRIFLTFLASLLVGFVTAALSIVRLVNDKEGKTSDYRQAWCDSVRKCFADLAANINLTASQIINHHECLRDLNELIKNKEGQGKGWTEVDTATRTLYTARLAETEEQIRILRRDLFHGFSFTKLHFKPDDLKFRQIERDIEHSIDEIKILMQRVDADPEEQLILKNRIAKLADDIVEKAREILKIEWEIVKKGERAYERTKLGSLIVGGIALLILLVLGVGFFANRSGTTKVDVLGKSAQDSSAGLSSVVGGSVPANSITQVVNVVPLLYSTAPILNPKIPKKPEPKCEKKLDDKPDDKTGKCERP